MLGVDGKEVIPRPAFIRLSPEFDFALVAPIGVGG